jgi:hypothetical protein
MAPMLSTAAARRYAALVKISRQCLLGARGLSWGWVSALDLECKQSLLLTRIAATENDSLCAPIEKLTAFLELESSIRAKVAISARKDTAC